MHPAGLGAELPPTDSTQQRRDVVPNADAAHAEPLSDRQFQVQQGEALKHQRNQVRDEECTW